MRAVGTRDTAPELVIRRALWRAGVRYRVHRRIGRARPDLTFASSKVAVFIDGCFWHGCPEHYSPPRQNGDFWRKKIATNRARDTRNDRELAASGWVVLRIWECEVEQDADAVIRRIKKAIARQRRA